MAKASSKKSAPVKKAAAKKSAAAAKKTTKKSAPAPAKKSAAASNKKKAAKKETTKKKTAAVKKSAPAKATKKTKAVIAPKKSTAAASKTSTTANKNAEIIDIFTKLAVYEAKAGEGFKSQAYKKAAESLTRWVKLGNTITSGKDIAKLANVGKATATKTDEFLKTGKVKKLEEHKALYGPLPDSNQAAASSSAKSSSKSAAKSTPGASKALDANTMKKISDEENKLYSLTNDALKGLARLNNQKVSGTKDDLVERLGHQVVLGAVVRCTSCGGGKLQFNKKTGRYFCPGYHDDEDFVKCGATFNHSTQGSELREPWKTS